MYPLPKTKYLVAFCLTVIGGLSIFMVSGLTPPPVESASVIRSTSSMSDDVMKVEVLPSRISESDRKTFRDRLVAFIGAETLEKEVVEEELPVKASDSLEEVSSEDGVDFASSVDFCDSMKDRIAGTFSPQGSTTVSLGEGARIIMLNTEEGGEDTVRVLQVPETPLYREKTDCIKEAIVGIGLDGRYVYAGIPYTTEREGLVGYARDGFGIFAPEENGGTVTSAELDVCHGHLHEVVWDGVVRSLYHYHVTNDAPFTIGCYRALPVE